MATEQAADQTASEAGTSRGVAGEIETHLEVVPGDHADTTDPALVPTAAVVPPAWGPEVGAPEVAGVGVGNRVSCRESPGAL